MSLPTLLSILQQTRGSILKSYMEILNVPGDGLCLYSAFFKSLYKKDCPQQLAMTLRATAISFLKDDLDKYRVCEIEESVENHIQRMEDNPYFSENGWGEWMDACALADYYEVTVAFFINDTSGSLSYFNLISWPVEDHLERDPEVLIFYNGTSHFSGLSFNPSNYRINDKLILPVSPLPEIDCNQFDLDFIDMWIPINSNISLFGSLTVWEFCGFYTKVRDVFPATDMLFLGRAPYALTVRGINNKPLLIKALSKIYKAVIIPNKNPQVLIKGNIHLRHDLLLQLLRNCNIKSFRVSAYGLKTLLKEWLPLIQPLESSFQLDVGLNFKQRNIVLSSFTKATTFQMLGPLGEGYGSCRCGENYHIEWTVYPLLVHYIKNLTKFSMQVPRSNRQLRRVVGYLKDLFDALQLYKGQLGGLRIEIRLRGLKCLKDVNLIAFQAMVKAKSLIKLKEVSEENYFLNILNSFEKLRNKFKGTDMKKPKLEYIRDWAACMNAFGFYSGYFMRYVEAERPNSNRSMASNLSVIIEMSDDENQDKAADYSSSYNLIIQEIIKAGIRPHSNSKKLFIFRHAGKGYQSKGFKTAEAAAQEVYRLYKDRWRSFISC